MAEEPGPKNTIQGLRVAVGLALGIAALAFILTASLWLVALVLAAIAGWGMWEYTRLALPGDKAPVIITGVAAAIAATLAGLAGPAGSLAALGLSLSACLALALAKGGDLAPALDRLLRLGWGIFYLGGALSCLLVLFHLENGRHLVIFLVAAVAAADTGAFFSGKLAGRHKMAPRISPNKTLEGLAGGLALAGVTGAGMGLFLLPEMGAPKGAFIGLGLGGLAVLGDLLESLIKRAAGAKDSGSLLPGHGGVLDRVDGLLLAGPGLLLARLLGWG
ncbi:MAG: phosphatidate cytidylyltransferase [Desulfarculaceae bacterium]